MSHFNRILLITKLYLLLFSSSLEFSISELSQKCFRSVKIEKEKIVKMEIIGAGFCRSGTMSTQKALQDLGFAPCYHMKGPPF